MAYYSYTPESAELGTPANLELITADEEDLQNAKHRLIEWIHNDFLGYVANPENGEIVDFETTVGEMIKEAEAIDNLDPKDVPIKIAVPYLARNDEELVIDSTYGLALITSDDEIGVTISPDHIEVDEQDVRGIDDDPEVMRQVFLGRYSCWTIQIEPILSEGDFQFGEHISLGYPDPSDRRGYIPMVTVLNKNHPLRA